MSKYLTTRKLLYKNKTSRLLIFHLILFKKGFNYQRFVSEEPEIFFLFNFKFYSKSSKTQQVKKRNKTMRLQHTEKWIKSCLTTWLYKKRNEVGPVKISWFCSQLGCMYDSKTFPICSTVIGSWLACNSNMTKYLHNQLLDHFLWNYSMPWLL